MSSFAPPRITREQVDRWSLAVFVVVVVCAVPFLLYLGRDQWFVLDEWWILGDGEDSFDGYFNANNGHWSTVVTIAFRVNYWLWGLNTYVPYQVPVILLHLGSAVLLRVVMRRLGVRGWIATVAALIFVFFGSGHSNIFFGFQISMTGSLFCGLALLLLADRDGPIDRRDWWALAVGVIGLMTSGVFVPLVVGVGIAMLLRRGLWVAAFYTVPLGLIYSVWYLLYGRESAVQSSSSLGEVVRFVVRLLSDTLTSFVQSNLGGLALGLVALGAVAVAVARAVQARDVSRLALLAALFTAWIMHPGLMALARGYPPDALLGDMARHFHISAALVLPLVALGAEYLARWNLVAGAVPLVLLAVGLPGNLDAMANRNPYVYGNRTQVLALAHSEHIDDVPPDLEPFPGLLGRNLPITTGWLAREAEAGNIPRPTDVSPAERLHGYGLLALQQDRDTGNGPECPRAREKQVAVALAQGDSIVYEGNIRITVRDGQDRSRPVRFSSALGSTIVAGLGPLDVVVTDAEPGQRPRLCEPLR